MSTVEFVTAPGTLADKVSYGRDGCDYDHLAEAEALIAEIQGMFVTRMRESLEALQGYIVLARDVPAANGGDLLASIGELVREMQQDGASFGFPLVTRIADSLQNFIAGRAALATDDIATVRGYMDALDVVLSEGLCGDGGSRGVDLMCAVALLDGSPAG